MASKASRDLGLQRISRSTRYLAIGALVAGGALSAAVAKALPGRSGHPATSSGQKVPSSTQSGGSGGTQSAGSGSTGSVGAGSSGSVGTGSNGSAESNRGEPATSPTFSPPEQAPQPAYNPPVVSSGGS